MEHVPVYLNENLIIGQVYYLRQVYMLTNQVFLTTAITAGVFKNKWNTTNSHKFNIMDITYDGVYVSIKGMAKNAESFNELNIDQFLMNHYWWIINCHDVNAYYLGEIEPGETAESILEEEETKKLFKKVTTVVIVIIVIITLWFMSPKVYKAIRRK